jgi:hypothetical protein
LARGGDARSLFAHQYGGDEGLPAKSGRVGIEPKGSLCRMQSAVDVFSGKCR